MRISNRFDLNIIVYGQTEEDHSDKNVSLLNNLHKRKWFFTANTLMHSFCYFCQSLVIYCYMQQLLDATMLSVCILLSQIKPMNNIKTKYI